MFLLEELAFPAEQELRAERFRLIETLDALTEEDFESGSTLCTDWSPRDILAHVISTDYLLGLYAPYGFRVNFANQVQVERARRMSRGRLMSLARRHADSPTGRVWAALLFADVSFHHQDVIRGLGLSRDVPEAVANVIFRDGMHLSLWLNRRVLRYRLEPTDGHRPIALPTARKGRTVRGRREALGMWLGGRD
jgi:uncharacterized protein (TIGR03083 family)